jgi:hypothetical protein
MRSLWLLNLLLALAAAALLEGVVSLALDRPSAFFAEGTAEVPPKASVLVKAEPELPARPAAARAAAEFAAIVDKDLFRNPNPEPVIPAPAGRPAPAMALPPLPALLGTIFVGEERKAVLREQNRTESYSLGQTVAGGVLKQIETDRIVIERGGAQVEVLLRASIESAPGSKPPARPAGRGPGGTTDAPAGAARPFPGGAAPGAPAPAGGPAPPAGPGGAAPTAPGGYPVPPPSAGAHSGESEGPGTAAIAGPPGAAPASEAQANVGALSREERIRRVREGLERRNQLRQQQQR